MTGRLNSDRLDVATAERLKLLESLCRDALRDLTWVYDTFGLEHGSGVARGTINQLTAALKPACRHAYVQRVQWSCEHCGEEMRSDAP